MGGRGIEDGNYTVKSAFLLLQGLELEEPIPVFNHALLQVAAPYLMCLRSAGGQCEGDYKQNKICINGEFYPRRLPRLVSFVTKWKNLWSTSYSVALFPSGSGPYVINAWLGVLTVLPENYWLYFLQHGADLRTQNLQRGA